MKKIILLLASGIFMIGANAQENNQSVVFTKSTEQLHQRQTVIPPMISGKQNFKPLNQSASTLSTARTTAAGGSRWYDYGYYIDTTNVNGSLGVSSILLFLWNDTTSTDMYSNGLGNNTTVSMGNVFQPWMSGFNDTALYSGQMGVTAKNAYKVDSVRIFGIYGRSNSTAPAKLAVVDTLRLGFVYGGKTSSDDIIQISYPGASADYGVDTLFCEDLFYDSTYNVIGSVVSGLPLYKDIYLTSADTALTFFYDSAISISGFNVPAGELVGMSISFISGDTSFHKNDTVYTGDTTTTGFNFGMFEPLVLFQQSGGAPIFPAYTKSDLNEGLFKTLPAYLNGYDEIYVPQWAWSTSDGTAGSVYQYPYVQFHVTCATCVLTDTIAAELSVPTVSNINSVSAYPNPAVNSVNIHYTLNQSQDVTVSLLNILGEVVKAEDMGNMKEGNAVFNTDDLAAGMYLYSVNANGEIFTGHVTVAH